MAAKRFHVARPDELRTLAGFAKEGSLSALVKVWTAAVRREGKTRWDEAFYVGFSGDAHKNAEVVRIDGSNTPVYCATLRYNTALWWCEQHLRPVYD